MTGGRSGPAEVPVAVENDRIVAARVGQETIHADELAAFGPSPDPGVWVEDELLAQLALEMGLDNPVVSGFVQRRARQLYLRDAVVSQALAGVAPPTPSEVFALMRSDSTLFMVERHYFEMLCADSALAESLLARVRSGQSFQVLAENASLGQKAALGGDLGFLVGGELTGRGFPSYLGRLEGLGGLVRSDMGWHFFLVTETRALTDTARVLESLSEVMTIQRRRAVVDSLVALAVRDREVEVNGTCWR